MSELGFSRSDRFSPDFTTDTWTYRISTDANPHENLNVVMNYTVQLYASDQPGAANRRDEIELNTNYRLTPTLFLRGGASYMQEDQEHNLIQDYSMSWNLTNTISTNFSGRWQLSSNYNTRTLGSQINFLLSSRTNMYFSYSQNRIENTQAQETVSYQAGFNTSF